MTFVVLSPKRFTPASGMVSLAVQVYLPAWLVCREGKERRGGDGVTSLDRLASSLVQVSSGVPLIPSCIDAEQFSVRGCPAISKRLKGSILTVGGEGTAIVA